MDGLDKLTGKIMDDAKSEAEKILSEANAQAQDIMTKAKANAQKTGEEILSQADVDCMNIVRGADVTANLEGRKKLLSVRRLFIQQAFDNALDKLKNLETADYFVVLLRILEKTYTEGVTELILSQKDKARIPKEFEKGLRKLEDIRPGKENKITISEQNAPFDGGFILKYKEWEENCSFDSILKTKREELEDQAAKTLFSA